MKHKSRLTVTYCIYHKGKLKREFASKKALLKSLGGGKGAGLKIKTRVKFALA